MDVNLRHLRSFIAVAELGSFTRAARLLHMSQPALTVQVRKLEEALKIRLLDRDSRSVALTSAGRELLPALEAALRGIDEIVLESHQQGIGKRGVVRIATLPSLAASLLPATISRFRAAQPGVTFVVRDAVASRVVDLVEGEEADLGITGGEGPTGGLEVLARSKDRLCVVFARDHPLATKRRVMLRDIVDLPLVLTDSATSVRAVVESAFFTVGRRPIVACETTYMMTAVAMVSAGLGVTVLPSSAREVAAIPNVLSKPIDGAAFVRQIFLIKKRGRTLPPSCAAFAASCMAAMKPHAH